MIPLANTLGLGVLAWSPLGEGILSGKYSKKNREAQASGSESNRADLMNLRRLDERGLAIADAVQEVADELGRAPAQVALNWLRHKGVIPLLGASKLLQIESNLASLEFDLTDEQVARLDGVSRIDYGFPYDFYATVLQGMYGGFAGRVDTGLIARNDGSPALIEALEKAKAQGTHAAWSR